MKHFHLEGRRLLHKNGVCVGTIEPLEDGYQYFWPEPRPGAWPAYALREIADLLDELNAEWDAQVYRELGP